MPNVTEQTYSLTAQTAMSNALLTDLESQGTAGCSLVVFNSADQTCATFVLSDPPALVDVDGKLQVSFTANTAPVVQGGTATYVEIQRADNSVLVSYPVIKSTAASSGRFAMTSTTLINGTEINITSFEIS